MGMIAEGFSFPVSKILTFSVFNGWAALQGVPSAPEEEQEHDKPRQE